MKKRTKSLLGVVVVFILAISTIVAVFYLTSGMVSTANYFFNAVKQKDIAKARSYLAEDFKASTDEKALMEFLSKGAILNFKEFSWSERQVSGGRGELNGSITTDTGGVVPIKMMFVKENNSWKIYAIQKPTAGLQSEDSSPTAPNKADQISLVKQSMHDFIISVEKKNMEHFRSTVSHLWQQQHTTETLNKAFEKIINSGGNWQVLEGLTPVLSSDAKIEENGVLLLTGQYLTKPSQVNFEQKYVYEELSWKLIGFNIEARLDASGKLLFERHQPLSQGAQ
jgi:hypothetical protein